MLVANWLMMLVVDRLKVNDAGSRLVNDADGRLVKVNDAGSRLVKD